MGTISLKEALQIFNRRESSGAHAPFNISFRTFSKQTKRGGQMIVYEGVRYLPPADPKEDELITKFNVLDPVKTKRDPKHFENRTRNVELPDGEIRKINIDFIILVNDNLVIY